MKSIIKNVFITTLLTIGMLFVAEALLRLFNVIPTQIPRPVFHSNLLGDFDPNLDTKETLSGKLTYHIKTNSQGLRSNKEFSEIKPENTIRVLCIGDSFTYGTGVDSEANSIVQSGDNGSLQTFRGKILFGTQHDPARKAIRAISCERNA